LEFRDRSTLLYESIGTLFKIGNSGGELGQQVSRSQRVDYWCVWYIRIPAIDSPLVNSYAFKKHRTMDSQIYPVPEGLHAIPLDLLDLRPDSEVDHDLLHPKPITDEKNVWFFWHTSYTQMHPYTQRNVRVWHRRFSKKGWTIRVLDRLPSSPLNIANFLDVSDPGTFPRAFLDGTVGGDYAPQHTSDLVRFPLLLKYGGVYTDVGIMPIGDLDRLWHETVADPASQFEVLSYHAGSIEERVLMNYFLGCHRNNPLFERCHKLFLELWASDGRKTSTEGMHSSPLLKELPLLGGRHTIEEGGKKIGPAEVSKMLTDYVIQGQVMTLVVGLVDARGFRDQNAGLGAGWLVAAGVSKKKNGLHQFLARLSFVEH